MSELVNGIDTGGKSELFQIYLDLSASADMSHKLADIQARLQK